jgi:simple sugar transport system permease protein
MFDLSLVLTEMIPLVIIGLGLVIAFRARIWNIGAEGQFMFGALVGGAFALHVPIGSPFLAIPIVLVVGAASGALWGALVAVARVRWQVNEVISSLLLNYVALFIFAYAVRKPLRDPGGFQPTSERIPDQFVLADVPVDQIRVHIGIIFALLLVPLVSFLVNRSPFGLRATMFGMNPEAAQAAGVHTSRMTVRIMLLSGAFAGLAGIIQVMGSELRLSNNMSTGFGFTAIVVALISRLRPIGVVVAAALLGALTLGGDVIQRTQQVPRVLTMVIQAIFVLFLLLADRRREEQ